MTLWITPGPWGFTYDGSSDWTIGEADDPQGKPVAHVWVPHYRETHTIVAGVRVADVPCDVRLIAAAPDLLVAAKVALNDQMYKDWPRIADLLVAAITKAEGRE